MENPFVLKSEEYVRDINFMAHYVRDTATYLNLMSDKPMDECLTFVKNSLKADGRFPFKDPEIIYTEREDYADRKLKKGTLYRYIQEAVNAKDLIAPTLTTYVNPEIFQSPLVDFIDVNVKLRGVAKKAMFAAKQAGDKRRERFKKGEQQTKKLANNAISGAHVSASTPLFNKTSHSTLTSNCRSTSGYGNANNEKFLSGNRHYWSPDIVRNNIISVINNTDLVILDQVITKYGIKYPTPEEVIDLIKFSTNLYWNGKDEHEKLAALVHKLSDVQRAAFAYVGDLYHLMKFNEDVVRTFITKLSDKVTMDITYEDADKIVDAAPDDIKTLAVQICEAELLASVPPPNDSGKKQNMTNIKDLKGKHDYIVFASTVMNIKNTIHEYRDLIRALWVTQNVPASVAYFPSSIRRAAITSDTDSTIFTVQDWVQWHTGALVMNPRAKAVYGAMIFLAANTIVHVLAKMSANFGIEQKRLYQIAMKNEYSFPVFVPTSIAKHYFALISCQEGNLYVDYDEEIKGVHLKSSNAPKEITNEAKKMMEFIMNSAMEGKKLNARHLLTWVADVERRVLAALLRGDHNYFRLAQIKQPNSYKNGEDASAYQQYLMWQEVFAPKYGDAPPPPYSGIKVNVKIDNPTRCIQWIESMEDRELAARVTAYLEKTGKRKFGSMLLLPEQIVTARGLPKEIADAMDIRSIILDTVNIFYIVLDSLGITMLNNKSTRMCYDTF